MDLEHASTHTHSELRGSFRHCSGALRTAVRAKQATAFDDRDLEHRPLGFGRLTTNPTNNVRVSRVSPAKRSAESVRRTRP